MSKRNPKGPQRGSNTPKPHGRISAAKRRDQIIAAAARLFSTKGYASTTLQDIMSEVGITGAAYYYYFDNKEDVLVEILNREMQRVEEFLLRLQQDPTLSATEKLRKVIAEHSQGLAENATTSRVLFNELKEASQPTARDLRRRMRRYTNELISLYKEGVATGELLDVDAEVAISGLLGMANWVHRWYNPKRHPSPKEVGEILGYLAAHGLSQNAPRQAHSAAATAP